MEPRIDAARAWLVRNGLLLTALVMVVVGAFLAVAGFERL
jgi:hypothetical protein